MMSNQIKQEDSCKSESGKTKCYIVVSEEMKMKLFQLVEDWHMSIRKAAELIGIGCSNAKKIMKKRRENRRNKRAKRAQTNSRNGDKVPLKKSEKTGQEMSQENFRREMEGLGNLFFPSCLFSDPYFRDCNLNFFCWAWMSTWTQMAQKPQ